MRNKTMTMEQLINTQPSFKRTLTLIPSYCLFCLLIFTPLARGSVQGWAVTVIHIVTLIAVTAILLDKTEKWEWRWVKTPFDKPILALLILCTASSIFSTHRHTSFWATALMINYIIIFYLIIHTTTTVSQFKRLIYLIIGVAAFLSMFGIIKFYGRNPFPWWQYSELSRDVPRLSSTFGNPNHLAGYMEMVVLLLSGLLLSGFRRMNRMMLLCVIPFLFISLILTISRGGWISTVVGFIFFFTAILVSKKFTQKGLILPSAAFLIVISLVVLVYTPSIKRVSDIEQMENTPNFKARVKMWGGIVEMIKDYPIFGTGPGTFSIVFTQYQPSTTPVRYFYGHNDYLHFISETGIGLAVIMIWLIIVFYKTGFQKLTHSNGLNNGIALGAMSGVTAILVHSIVDFNLHIPANAILFTMLCAFVTPPFLNLPGNRKNGSEV